MTDSSKKKVPQSGAISKKAYRTPMLSQYGDVKRLTGGGAGSGIDGGAITGMTRVCWIAEALYGIDTPRVVLVRAWLARCLQRRVWWALFILPLYLRFGQRVAALVRTIPAMKWIFRPVFDRAVRSAYREYSTQASARRDFA